MPWLSNHLSRHRCDCLHSYSLTDGLSLPKRLVSMCEHPKALDGTNTPTHFPCRGIYASDLMQSAGLLTQQPRTPPEPVLHNPTVLASQTNHPTTTAASKDVSHPYVSYTGIPCPQPLTFLTGSLAATLHPQPRQMWIKLELTHREYITLFDHSRPEFPTHIHTPLLP